MRGKAPKVSMFLRRLLNAIKGVKQAIQQNTKSIHAAEERERKKEASGKVAHRIISFDDKTVGDAQKESDRQYRNQKSIKWATWSAVIAACIYAAISAWQGHQARRSADAATESLREMKKQFQMDQRPRISLLSAVLVEVGTNRVIKVPIKGKPIMVDITYKNVGKSAAIDFVVHRHILFGKQVRNIRGEPMMDNIKGSVFDSQETHHTGVVSTKDTFVQENAIIDPSVVSNWDGSDEIVIFGRFSYQDVSGNRYCLPYVYQLLVSGAWLDVTEWLDTNVTPPIRHTIDELCPGVGER